MNSSANGLTQNVTCSVTDAPLETILKSIKQQTGYFFSFRKDDLRKSKPVSANFKNLDLKAALKLIFNKQPLVYEILNKTIVIDGVTEINQVNVSQPIEPSAAPKPIKGVVKNSDGEPLAGASVTIKGTKRGTTTNTDGSFSFSADPGEILEVEMIGYAPFSQKVGNQAEFTIALEVAASSLKDVVVVAYGVQKKGDLTGSISSIKSDEIVKVAATRLDDAIRGKIAGVQVSPTSSQPGAAASIRVRGTNSLTGNSSPLYVIDGLIGSGNNNFLNMSDIESVEVLKDASATALYGSRGSAGVVLITTKRGKTGKMVISYDGSFTSQAPNQLLPMMNAAEFGAFQNEVKGTTVYPNPSSLGEGTNWQKEIYRNHAPMTNHTLSLAGGTENARFFISGNYFNQDGIFLTSNLKRYQLRVNGDYKVGKRLTIGNSITFARTEGIPKSSSIVGLGGFPPNLPVKDTSGAYTYQTYSPEFSGDNPVSVASQTINKRTNNAAFGTLYGEFTIIKGLKYKLNLGADVLLSKNGNYSPGSLYNQRVDHGSATIGNDQAVSVLIEQTLTYIKSIKQHSFDALFGYTTQTINNNGSSETVKNFTTDYFTYNNLNAGTNRFASTSYANKFGVKSYLFRLNYGFRNKYKVTLNGRADGSSNFAKNHKWGFFPSAAVAWNLNEEPFIKRLGVFDALKFRTSYGQLGNPASGGSSLARLGTGGAYNYIFGGAAYTGIGLARLGNDNLQFETTNQLDIGLEAGFLKDRISVTIDYYRKRTNNLFTNLPVPLVTGVTTATIVSNFGSVSNQGFEFLINSTNITSKKFKWETSFNISTNKNKVISIPDPTGQLLTNYISETVVNPATALIKEGQPIGVFYGLQNAGIWHNAQEITAAGITKGLGVFAGGKRYLDLSGPNGKPDGIIDDYDRTLLGNPFPKIFGGLNNTFSYGQFDFSFYWAFVSGNKIFNTTNFILNTSFDNNVAKRFVNRWTSSNTATDVPSVAGIARSQITSESSEIEDGSFIRLRNVNLGYTVPLKAEGWLTAARIYISAVNPILFSHYSGYDPEINRGDDNVRRGYDDASDPSVKSFSIGVNLKF